VKILIYSVSANGGFARKMLHPPAIDRDPGKTKIKYCNVSNKDSRENLFFIIFVQAFFKNIVDEMFLHLFRNSLSEPNYFDVASVRSTMDPARLPCWFVL
jgi:hypothetical protein